MAFRALLGSISLAAAGSGGAMIDCVAISGVAGDALRRRCLRRRRLVGGCDSVGLAAGFDPILRAACRVRAPACDRRGPVRGAGCGLSATGPAWSSDRRDGGAAGLGGCGSAVAAGEACAEPCRAIAPVTESRPCSSAGDAGIQPVAVAVEVSIGGGEPPRLVLGFPGDRLDLLRLPVRSAAAIWSRCKPSDDWLAITAKITAPTAPTPHDPIRHSARRSNSSSSASKPLSTPPESSVSKPSARWSGILGQTPLALLQACRIKGKH